MVKEFTKRMQSFSRPRLVVAAALLAVACAGAYGYTRFGTEKQTSSEVSSQSRKGGARYAPSAAEWASLTFQTVSERTFRSELVTEGKIGIDEDRSTPVYSPYTGRVTRLMVRPGDAVVKGQPLFVIEAADTVQAQNDYVAAMTGLNKAQSALDLAQIQEKRAKDLSEGKAIPLKDYQQAQAALVQAQNDARSAQTLLEAAQNKLRILGFSDDDITTLRQKGRLNPETTVFAPIGGTVVQRKAGPGQYVSTGASDPVYVIGDLSTVWLIAFVRESDADSVAVGQDLTFSVMALPGKVLNARVNYVAAAIDATSRRLLVRATIDNADKRLKPEMFANVTLYSKGDHPAVGVPKQALIYEGDQVRVWVARPDDKTIELRQIKPGLINGDLVEVAGNLKPGEQIVTKGSLFIDRAASGT
ncbi:cobalt-zinc-cadmium efflux system membrane fusion protein [Bradyrhizobium japonicum]|jgi:membrane fusion protein, heavy metal efflux system|uniref:Cobalt-zinc-cadmium efflux system membrane fusion protein n=2 Tax=Bradyrhizobium elkanii TaxID=29448 RepID=A0A1E3EX34_BRAEL|nr:MULTISPECIES: efflux RND transporter periplasmic adaptor subunit [Bradyrhizobium]MBR1158960.1 efflux RND transporter periplasmic adaptor subunit [Bradyrhizobium elkanii]MDH6693115.1 cobalt-zinc-cadmium efflux system membrane fusion protein [Bradyrhizobium elkanii]MTV14417.1 efflux RND transporter periplasmic adaptor subunit [Bradyrhizobium sp. BR2003]NWL37118.1 efflux RND transporter periplasmic adaptor subunit [Bradyrhizobium elkanii]NWL74914.1 efflux RND transporter periplasmic adaptor su